MTSQAAARFDGKNSKFDRPITCFERASTATEWEKRQVSYKEGAPLQFFFINYKNLQNQK